MSFYKELVAIEKQLEERGFTVNIPISAQTMKKNKDFDVSHFKDVFGYQEKGSFIHKNFETITKGESILVINGEKHGIKGYIGANVLMEIAIAFYFKKKIYIWNAVDEKASHMEELLSFGVVFVNRDVEKIL
jgi:hypothetical protein